MRLRRHALPSAKQKTANHSEKAHQFGSVCLFSDAMFAPHTRHSELSLYTEINAITFDCSRSAHLTTLYEAVECQITEIRIVAGKSNVIWHFNKLLLLRVMRVLLMSNCQIEVTRKYHVAPNEVCWKLLMTLCPIRLCEHFRHKFINTRLFRQP